MQVPEKHSKAWDGMPSPDERQSRWSLKLAAAPQRWIRVPAPLSALAAVTRACELATETRAAARLSSSMQRVPARLSNEQNQIGQRRNNAQGGPETGTICAPRQRFRREGTRVRRRVDRTERKAIQPFSESIQRRFPKLYLSES
jgi:hypothetical protein